MITFGQWMEGHFDAYENMSIDELISVRDKLQRDIEQERRAINTDNPHADLRSSIAHANARTLQLELNKVWAVYYRKTGDKASAKMYEKMVKKAEK